MRVLRFPALALAFAASGVAVVSPVRAQEALSMREAEIDLAGFADCVVGKRAHRAPVAAFLRTIPDSANFYPASMKAADMSCLNEAAVRRGAAKLEMRLQPGTFRDALYPALYRRDFGKGGAPMVADVAPTALPVEFDGDSAALSDSYRARRAFGDCLARRDPADAHTLLVARPYSPAETSAIAGLTPQIGACIADGQTVTLRRADLRANIGEAMYKLAVAARQSAGGS